MEKKFCVIDIVLTVVLVVVMCLGIVSVSSTDLSGKLTLENYDKYLTIRQYANDYKNNKINYTIKFDSPACYKLTDINVTLSISGRSIEPRQIEVSFDTVNGINPYEYELLADCKPLPYGEGPSWYGLKITVVSISGQYSRGEI